MNLNLDLTNQIAQNIQTGNTSYSIPCEQLVTDSKDIENQIIALSQECSLYEQTNTDKVNAYLCLIDKLATIENMLREVFSKATTNDVDLSFAAYEALIYIGCSLGLASLVVTGVFYPSVIAAALAIVIGVLPAAVALIAFGLFLLLAATGSMITTDPMIAQLTWWIAENIIPIGLFLGQLTYGAAILIMPYILTAFSLAAVGLLTYGAGVGLHAIYQNSSRNKLFDQCLTEKLIRHGFMINSEVHTETSQAKDEMRTGIDLPQLKERLDIPMQLEDSLGLQGMEL